MVLGHASRQIGIILVLLTLRPLAFAGEVAALVGPEGEEEAGPEGEEEAEPEGGEKEAGPEEGKEEAGPEGEKEVSRPVTTISEGGNDLVPSSQSRHEEGDPEEVGKCPQDISDQI